MLQCWVGDTILKTPAPSSQLLVWVDSQIRHDTLMCDTQNSVRITTVTCPPRGSSLLLLKGIAQLTYNHPVSTHSHKLSYSPTADRREPRQASPEVSE